MIRVVVKIHSPSILLVILIETKVPLQFQANIYVFFPSHHFIGVCV